MMSRSAALLALQELEYELRESLGRYKRVQKEREGSPEVRRARQAYEKAEEAEKRARARQTDLNLEWQQLLKKLDREEKRLYDGSIRDPRELTNLELEVEMLKKQRAKLEEMALELIQEVDQLAAETVQRRTAYESLDEADRAHQQAMEQEEKQLKRAISLSRVERDKLLGAIDEGTLEQFRHVQRLKNDARAVATLEDGVCSACHVQVSAAKRDTVERADTKGLVTCGNCGRILVT